MISSTRILVAVALSTATLLLGCSGSPLASVVTPPAAEPTSGASERRSQGGDVTVLATWSGPESGLTVEVTLDTHSVDLDALDLSDASLRNDRGESLEPLTWSAPKGGHHRAGPLVFQGDQRSFLGDAKWLELVLLDIGDVPERVLRWELPA